MMKKSINKIHQETCNLELKNASFLRGNETEKELENILNKCLDIQGLAILNDIRKD